MRQKQGSTWKLRKQEEDGTWLLKTPPFHAPSAVLHYLQPGKKNSISNKKGKQLTAQE